MNIDTLKHRVKKLKLKKERIQLSKSDKELIEEPDALSILDKAEIHSINQEINFLEKKILEHQ